MKLRPPFFSPVAVIGTLLLLGLVGAKIHSGGGLVLSPGELSAWHQTGVRLQGFSSHAEFEADCAQCHQPWRGISAARCRRCHTEVARQIRRRRGVHGAIDRVTECASCHPDHRGRYATMTGRTLVLAGFDHRRTAFRLDGAHARVACERCHPGSAYRNAPTTCAGCHPPPESHDEKFAGDCAACHLTRAWPPARWDDHPFPLDHGGGADCATCHPVTDTEYTCYGCHEHRRDRMVRRHREEPMSDAELDDCLACHYSRRAGRDGDRREEHRRGHGDEGEGREHERGGGE